MNFVGAKHPHYILEYSGEKNSRQQTPVLAVSPLQETKEKLAAGIRSEAASSENQALRASRCFRMLSLTAVI